MKAAQISAYDGPSSVNVTDQATKPEPAADQVLVQVHAAGVNPFDNVVSLGFARQMVELNFPATLGGDLAGTVVALGADVTGLEVGQAVYGQANALSSQGSFAEFAAAKAESLAPKPESVDFTTAAGFPLVSVSALQALESMQLQPGQKVLIHGGAGGIGSMAIQLAKNFGAYVITTASAGDLEYVKGLGADEVIDYQAQNFADVVTDIDAVFDTIGGETNLKSYGVLKSGGVLVSMVEPANDELVTKGSVRYEHQYTQVTSERLRAITKLIEAGQLTINIDKVFPLEQAADALEYLKTGHPRGKVVIQVS